VRGEDIENNNRQQCNVYKKCTKSKYIKIHFEYSTSLQVANVVETPEAL